jgi:hypothetical protein
MPGRSRRRRSSSPRSPRSPIEASALQRSQRHHNVTLRGRRANNVRAPEGMPIESNFIPIHRLGSRVRNYSQRMLQQERQLMRRRPHIAALRLAHSRPLNTEDPSNIRKFHDPVLGENVAFNPMIARPGRSKYNKEDEPLPISAMAQRLSPSRAIRPPPNEYELWEQWQRERDIERRMQMQMQIHRERSRAH